MTSLQRVSVLRPVSESHSRFYAGLLQPLENLLNLVRTHLFPAGDLPMAAIATALSYYVKMDPEISVNHTGELASLSAQLALMKSRELLPNLDSSDDLELSPETDDQQSMQSLIRYQPLIETLAFSLDSGRESFTRHDQASTIERPISHQPLPPGSIAAAYSRQIVERARRSAQISPPMFLRLEAATTALNRSLRRLRQVSLRDIIFGARLDRRSAVVYFLAVLELARQDQARVVQDAPFDDILIEGLGPG